MRHEHSSTNEDLSIDVVVVSSGENVNVPHHLKHVQPLFKRLWGQPEYFGHVRRGLFQSLILVITFA